MPYNYKQEAARYLEQMKNAKYSVEKTHALKAIIAMMWQAGVDNVNDLPEQPAVTHPEVLAAELNINSPFNSMVARKKKDLFWIDSPVDEYASPEKINEFFKSFKEHKKFKDPKVIEAENERRELHDRGLMSAGELYLAANYDPNKFKGLYLYGDTVKMTEDEFRPMFVAYVDFKNLRDAFSEICSYEGDELRKECQPFLDAMDQLCIEGDDKKASNNHGLKEAHQKLSELPSLLEKKVDTPSKYKEIELYKDGMTLYDLVDANMGGGIGDTLLPDALDTLEMPMPETGKKAEQRMAEFIEKDKAAKQEIEKHDWRTIDEVRGHIDNWYAHDPKGHCSTMALADLWKQVEPEMFPEEMRADLKHIQSLAIDLTHKKLSNPKLHTNTNLLEVYEKTLELPKLFETQIDTPERYREKYGDKMSYMSYFREQRKESLFGVGMKELTDAIENVNGYYGLGIDLNAMLAKSDRERETAPERIRQQQEQKRVERETQEYLKAAKNKANDESMLIRDAQARLTELQNLSVMGDKLHEVFSVFPEQMQMQKTMFGTKNKSLQPLKGMIEDLMTLTKSGQEYDEETGMEMAGKLLDIRAEAKRIAGLSKTQKDPARKEMIGQILEICNKAFNDPKMRKCLETYEEQTEMKQAEAKKEGKEPSPGESFVQKRQSQLKEMPSAEDCKSEEELKAYKETLGQKLAEIIAAKLIIKWNNASAEPLPQQEQLDMLNDHISEYAGEIRKNDDFKHMMASVELSASDLDQLRMKGATGNMLIDELSKHAKLVSLKEAKAQREASEKRAEAGLGKK